MPSILTHPLAPKPAARAGDAPKYLVRGDGMVVVYTAELAKLPGFTPADVLPAAHVVASREAAQRDAASSQARQAYLARVETAGPVRGEGRAVPAPAGAAAGPVVVAAARGAAAVKVAEVRTGTKIAAPAVEAAAPALDIGTADRAALKGYFASRQVKADLRRPVEELRALAHEVARKGHAPGGA